MGEGVEFLTRIGYVGEARGGRVRGGRVRGGRVRGGRVRGGGLIALRSIAPLHLIIASFNVFARSHIMVGAQWSGAQ